jgi:hypothetical protein
MSDRNFGTSQPKRIFYPHSKGEIMIPEKLGKFSKIRGTSMYESTVKMGATTIPVTIQAKRTKRKDIISEIEEKLLALFSNWEKVQSLFLTGAKKALARSGYRKESKNLKLAQMTILRILIHADDDDGDGFGVSLGIKGVLPDDDYVTYSNTFDLIDDDNGCELHSYDD